MQGNLVHERPAGLTLVQPRSEQDELTRQVVDRLGGPVAVRVVPWPLPVHDERDSLSGLATKAARLSALGLFAPVLACFGGLYIQSAGGFPGVHTQEICRQIGADGIIRLMGDEKNRTARWMVVLAFCSPGQPPRTFLKYVDGEIPHARVSDSEFVDAAFVRPPSGVALGLAGNPVKETVDEICREFLDWRSGPHPTSPRGETAGP